MCSGCSGYFEEDGEDRDPGDDRMPEREASWPGGFAIKRYGPWEARNDLARGAVGEGCEYEVLVGADFIVERHTIRAKCGVVSPQGVPEGVESREETAGNPGNYEHSLLASANSYRTRSQIELQRPVVSGGDGRCLIWWGLAGVTVLGLWLAVG
jgi:hypothetical protein